MKKGYYKCDIPKLITLSALADFHNPIYKSDFSFVGESHNFWEIMFIVNGSAEIVSESHAYILNGGQAFVHKPMEFHKIRPNGNLPVQALILCFHASAMPNLVKRTFEFNSDMACELQTLCRQAKGILTYDEFPGQPLSIIEGKEFEASMLLTSLEYLLHQLLHDGLLDLKPVKDRNVENYKIILDVMEKNIDKNLSVSDISNLCNIGESALRKNFHHYAGISVMKYFNSMKIRKAIVYLQEGKSVKETSQLLGFADQNYFSTVFKRVLGVPPREFIPHSEDSFYLSV